MIDFTNMNLGSNTLNLFDNKPTNNPPVMKLIYKNQEICIYSQLTRSFDRNTVTGTFYVSNNCDKYLNNVKFNFMVLKYMTLKVVSSIGTNLEPNQSLGIKKVYYSLIINNIFRKSI